MLAKRIIPCLDVRDGMVVKGVGFKNHETVGEIADLARRYADEGADELVFYDITASPQGRSADAHWVRKVAHILDIPFCVAGGIRSSETARRILGEGADKISINSPALLRPALINELADAFGSQCVVVGIDSHFDGTDWRVHMLTGDPDLSRDSQRRTLDWIKEVQRRGAGEIVLNCMNEDGRRAGYDLAQLSAVRAVCTVPLIASGGAGCMDDFSAVFRAANVDGALAASVFHKSVFTIGALKAHLAKDNIEVRL